MSFVHEVRDQQTRYEGPIFTVVTDEVSMPGGGTAHRDMITHVGVVGVAALLRRASSARTRRTSHLWRPQPDLLVDDAGGDAQIHHHHHAGGQQR